MAVYQRYVCNFQLDVPGMVRALGGNGGGIGRPNGFRHNTCTALKCRPIHATRTARTISNMKNKAMLLFYRFNRRINSTWPNSFSKCSRATTNGYPKGYRLSGWRPGNDYLKGYRLSGCRPGNDYLKGYRLSGCRPENGYSKGYRLSGCRSSNGYIKRYRVSGCKPDSHL